MLPRGERCLKVCDYKFLLDACMLLGNEWMNHIAPQNYKSVYMCGSDLESWFALWALWWPSSTGLYQNKLLTGDGGYRLSRAADFSQRGAVIHGWLVYSGPAGETRIKLSPSLSFSPSCAERQPACNKRSSVKLRCFFLPIVQWTV